MNCCQEVKNGPVLRRLEHDDDPTLTVNSSARLQNMRQGAVSAAERAGAGPVWSSWEGGQLHGCS